MQVTTNKQKKKQRTAKKITIKVKCPIMFLLRAPMAYTENIRPTVVLGLMWVW